MTREINFIVLVMYHRRGFSRYQYQYVIKYIFVVIHMLEGKDIWD